MPEAQGLEIPDLPGRLLATIVAYGRLPHRNMVFVLLPILSLIVAALIGMLQFSALPFLQLWLAIYVVSIGIYFSPVVLFFVTLVAWTMFWVTIRGLQEAFR